MFYWRWFNRPHHPFARLLIGVIGIALLAGVLALGFVALVAFAFIGSIVAITRALSRPSNPPAATATAQHNVIEGEYVVVPNRAVPLKR